MTQTSQLSLPQVETIEPEVFRSVSFRAESACSTDQAATLAEENNTRPSARPVNKQSISKSVNAILQEEAHSTHLTEASSAYNCPVHRKEVSGGSGFSKKVKTMKGLLNIK